MKRDAPRLDTRRTREFSDALLERARTWIPTWSLDDGERDFGRALLDVAARFASEVAERLDGAGELLRDGLFDWLGVHGEAARPARVPVAFKLADNVREGVLARAPVRLQASIDGASVVFETEADLQIVPAKLAAIVGARGDAFFLPPPGLASSAPREPSPDRWTLRSFAAANATRLQLEPAQGLSTGLVLLAAGRQYTVRKADKDLVEIDPPLQAGIAQGAEVRRVSAFAPFDPSVQDAQFHALYLGGTELFDIEAAATIDIVGGKGLRGKVQWAYWGKDASAADKDAVAWQPMPELDAARQPNDALALAKPEGAVELREIVPGQSARWIRAVETTVGSDPFTVDALRVRINGATAPTTCPPATGTPSAKYEAMANTTPLVLSNAFLPMGREPRQFDAFYVGSDEAFSKSGASVRLCFELSDLGFETLALLRTGSNPATILAGVSREGGLQLLSFDTFNARLVRWRDRPSLHPPSPSVGGARSDASSIAFARGSPIALWGLAKDFVAAATTEDGAVWAWTEFDDFFVSLFSGWRPLGTVPASPAPGQQAGPVTGLVYLPGPALLVAARDGKLYACQPVTPDPPWTELVCMDGPTRLEFARMAPIHTANPFGSSIPHRIVAVTGNNQKLYALDVVNMTTPPTCVKLLDNVDPTIAPAAIIRLDNSVLAAAVGTGPAGRSLLGWKSNLNTMTQQATDDAFIDTAPIVGNALEAGVANAHAVIAACVSDANARTSLLRWTPFDPPQPSMLLSAPIPAGLGPAAGKPLVLPNHVIVPALSSQVLVAGFDPTKALPRTAPLQTAVIVGQADPLVAGTRLAFRTASASPRYTMLPVVGPGLERSGRTLHAFDARAIDDAVLLFPAATTAPDGTSPFDINDPRILAIPPPVVANQTRLLIDTSAGVEVFEVVNYDAATNEATFDRDLHAPASPPASMSWWRERPTSARALPVLRLDPANSGNWDADLLGRVPVVFPGGDPEQLQGHAFAVDASNHPLWVDFDTPWVTVPPLVGSDVRFIVDGSVAQWTTQLDDTTSNPSLSWEYWNGTGWWNLDVVDGTRDLMASGPVTFNVPPDLEPTDWSGKTSHWIRARLIAGDYGRERVAVVSSPTNQANVTRQVVERSTDDIRAPIVARLHVSYATPDPLAPTWVLAQDSGAIRDQSDANRAPDAIVEAFVPLPTLLERLSAPTPGAGALYFGFEGPLEGAPVRLYLRAEEHAGHEALAPLRVDALSANGFVRIAAEDGTRALGESGLLTLTFDTAPGPRELFGKTLRWLRVAPVGDQAPWTPVLLDAHLNAVWARSAETQRYERLGSSNGAPDQVLWLARPPLLQDTLELRVREPLGDEERAALQAPDPTVVLRDVPDLPGDWVRWRQVFDPADEDANARVYALDEATGELRFGDGEHGMIPPTGQDSIVAFAYQRTEPARDGSDTVPANALAARDRLNPVSPVRGVDTVYAADQAAGGAPPESRERILRFGSARLRHRQRAMTARDLEDLALQSAPDVAQARAFAGADGVRLVAAMRNADPRPTAAQRRALQRFLLQSVPVSLTTPQALRVGAPSVRRLRVRLRLRVASLDVAGGVAAEARERIAALFDVATGGDGNGWPLGRTPQDGDFAFALVDTPGLDAIEDTQWFEIVDGKEQPWPATLRATDLVLLDDDAFRFDFVVPGEGA